MDTAFVLNTVGMVVERYSLEQDALDQMFVDAERSDDALDLVAIRGSEAFVGDVEIIRDVADRTDLTGNSF